MTTIRFVINPSVNLLRAAERMIFHLQLDLEDSDYERVKMVMHKLCDVIEEFENLRGGVQ